MRGGTRLIATIVLWSQFTFISMALIIVLSQSPGFDLTFAVLLVGMVLCLLVGVVWSTVAIWAGAPAEDPAKAKRTQSQRVRRLVESLNEDEIYELESMLLAQQQGETNRYRRS